MKVKNINGRRQNSCRCGTWLDHWVKICGRPLPPHCAEARCMGKPELGAHVQKDGSTDTDWYIIPLCVKHSIKAESLEIVDTTIFVSAHVSESCAKQLPIGGALPQEVRSAMALDALQNGADIGKAQGAPGHASSSTTLLYFLRKERPKEPPASKDQFSHRNEWIECGL
jgi:hypothetical protein